jgi:hypothetical protein
MFARLIAPILLSLYIVFTWISQIPNDQKQKFVCGTKGELVIISQGLNQSVYVASPNTLLLNDECLADHISFFDRQIERIYVMGDEYLPVLDSYKTPHIERITAMPKGD